MPDACAFRRPESPYAGHAGSRNARSGGKPIQGEKVVGRRRVEQALEQRQSGQAIRCARGTAGKRPASGAGLFPIHVAEKNLIARQGQRLRTRTAHRSGSKHESPLVQPLSRRHADQGGGEPAPRGPTVFAHDTSKDVLSQIRIVIGPDEQIKSATLGELKTGHISRKHIGLEAKMPGNGSQRVREPPDKPFPG